MKEENIEVEAGASPPCALISFDMFDTLTLTYAREVVE
jgi:hypothetical protein